MVAPFQISPGAREGVLSALLPLLAQRNSETSPAQRPARTGRRAPVRRLPNRSHTTVAPTTDKPITPVATPPVPIAAPAPTAVPSPVADPAPIARFAPMSVPAMIAALTANTAPAPLVMANPNVKLPYLMPGKKEKSYQELSEANQRRNGPNPAPTPLHPGVHSVRMITSGVPIRRAGTPSNPLFGAHGALTRPTRRPVDLDQAGPPRRRRRINYPGFR